MTKTNIDARAWQWLGFSAIAFFIVLVYSPSLMHCPRADQIMYLIEIAGRHSWWDLTAGAIDLNRHRLYNPGDELLFRPIFYLWLGTAKFFFGYNFLLWQAAGIVLHLAVVWALLRLLLLFHTGMASVMAAAFFALLFVNMEMVTWHHIHAYMIAVFCLLTALRHVYVIVDGKNNGQGQMVRLAAWLLMAAFAHELGSAAAVVVAITLWFWAPQHRKNIGWIAAVPVVYMATSLLNVIMHPLMAPPVSGTRHDFYFIVMHSDITRMLANAAYSVGAWLFTGLFPGEMQWLFAARNMIAPAEKHLIKAVDVMHWPVAVMLICAALMAWMIIRHHTMRKARWSVIVIAMACAFMFAAIIAAGRGSVIGIWDVLRINTYYFYMFWIFTVIAVYASVDWASTEGWTKRVLTVALCVMIIFNAHKLYAANEYQARSNNDIIVLVKSMELLIKEKGSESDFSFFVDAHYPGNYIYPELRRTDEPSRQYTFIEALYPQYFKSNGAKYKFLAKARS